ncbi:MAG: HEAT repeat domain-containing protein [Planctomycetota bacterium]
MKFFSIPISQLGSIAGIFVSCMIASQCTSVIAQEEVPKLSDDLIRRSAAVRSLEPNQAPDPAQHTTETFEFSIRKQYEAGLSYTFDQLQPWFEPDSKSTNGKRFLEIVDELCQTEKFNHKKSFDSCLEIATKLVAQGATLPDNFAFHLLLATKNHPDICGDNTIANRIDALQLQLQPRQLDDPTFSNPAVFEEFKTTIERIKSAKSYDDVPTEYAVAMARLVPETERLQAAELIFQTAAYLSKHENNFEEGATVRRKTSALAASLSSISLKTKGKQALTLFERCHQEFIRASQLEGTSKPKRWYLFQNPMMELGKNIDDEHFDSFFAAYQIGNIDAGPREGEMLANISKNLNARNRSTLAQHVLERGRSIIEENLKTGSAFFLYPHINEIDSDGDQTQRFVNFCLKTLNQSNDDKFRISLLRVLMPYIRDLSPQQANELSSVATDYILATQDRQSAFSTANILSSIRSVMTREQLESVLNHLDPFQIKNQVTMNGAHAKFRRELEFRQKLEVILGVVKQDDQAHFEAMTVNQKNQLFDDCYTVLPQCRSQKNKLACLKLMVEKFPKRSFERLSLLAHREDCRDIRTELLQLLAIHLDDRAAQIFHSFLEDDNPDVRAAAIDGISLLRDQPYSIFDPAGRDRRQLRLVESTLRTGESSLRLRPLMNYVWQSRSSNGNQAQRAFPADDVCDRDDLDARLRQWMATADSSKVRQAAARALVTSDVNKFRVAEWGVWLSNDDQFSLAKSVIDKLPPFVHQTQNPIREFIQFDGMQVIDKPIIHVLVDQPTSFDLKVTIQAGQTWFAYPKPNSIFVLLRRGTLKNRLTDQVFKSDYERLFGDRERIRFTDESLGYPWIETKQQRFNDVLSPIVQRQVPWGIGVEWQGVIALPKKANWMKERAVEGNQFQWWQDLRRVDSSWLSARNEAERFLYYDGPTVVPCKYHADTVANQVMIEIDTNKSNQPNDIRFRDPYRGLFIDVNDDGKIVGHLFEVENSVASQKEAKLTTNFSAKGTIEGEDVRRALRWLVQVDGGLTGSEADGLINAWQEEFLRKPGRRVLFRIERNHYDFICPIDVRPTPTEMSRVGLVLVNL